jgi:phytoene dehydrogenase-like protein
MRRFVLDILNRENWFYCVELLSRARTIVPDEKKSFIKEKLFCMTPSGGQPVEKSMVIVGAGIAGLSTGCYARMNGYRTTIFEMHSIPGGLCTAWKRKGYTWDISMHLLTNSRQGPFRKMWEELGVVGRRQFHYHRDYMRIEARGRSLDFGLDRNALEKAMLAISPADAKLIREFLDLFYGKGIMDAANLKPQELMGPADFLRTIIAILPLVGVMMKHSGKTIQDFAARFKDPFLRNAIRFIVDNPGWPMKQYPMAGMAGFLQSSMIDAGVPLGGSQQVMLDMAELFKKHGGDIVYKTQVKEPIIENGCVRGIRLENGEEHRSDIVVWAADGHHLIYDIFGGRYMNKTICTMYEEWTPVRPLVHVLIGVNRDLSKEPHRLLLELDAPITVSDEARSWLYILHHSFDPSMAPAGKSSVEAWFPSNYDYWERLSRVRPKYNGEKQRIARETIAAIDKRWPGFANQVEVIDVPTPATYVRYTGNWRGSPDGWYVTPGNLMKQKPVRSLPGLSGLYTVGQWTAPYTGTVMSAVSGRQLVQILCKKDGRVFKTSN